MEKIVGAARAFGTAILDTGKEYVDKAKIV